MRLSIAKAISSLSSIVRSRHVTMASGIKHRRVPAESLHVSKPTHWLESRFHFSFADYYNPNNQNFGALRVLNDDLVKAKEGFGSHPHANQEIFSYIVEGELSHADSKGNCESLGPGGVQYMSAGGGVWHSEMNNHASKMCRFLQVWITPEQRNLPVQYGSARFTRKDRLNRLQHIISGTGSAPILPPATASAEEYAAGPAAAGADLAAAVAAPIRLQQDCNVYVSELEEGVTVTLPLAAGRQAYLVCIDGRLHMNDGSLKLEKRDGAEVFGAEGGAMEFAAAGDEPAHFMVIEMKRQ